MITGILNIFVLWILLPFIIILVGESESSVKKSTFNFSDVFDFIKSKFVMRAKSIEDKINAMQGEIIIEDINEDEVVKDEIIKDEIVKKEDIKPEIVIGKDAIEKNKSIVKEKVESVTEEPSVSNENASDDEPIIIGQAEYEDSNVGLEDIPCYNPDTIEDMSMADEVIGSSTENREPWHEVLKSKSSNIVFDSELFYRNIEDKKFDIVEKAY
ncbi:hypothetical protein [Alkaliphilus sp. B6464]|uniref:hypothetical protein n=1 Tax=Alkaliphilus sp. B6464 TaxID=2731219 RepID=UPI001BAE3641|nr:hypothetical protein [Alkaliphilus sp. B6464]QUH22224.1 hypothetical protein HYG84_20160 [Alkaliphilus sp. B6464]